MTIEWIAFKANGDRFLSKDIEYSELPLNEITGFSVIGKKSSMYVNLITGKLAINGRIIKDHNIDEYIIKHLINNPKLRLFFSKRAYVDYNLSTGSASKEQLKYVECGWQTYSLKIYLKMNMPNEDIEIEIREIT